MAQYETTLALAADARTSALRRKGPGNAGVSVRIYVADVTTAAGTFYLASRVVRDGEWDRHPVHLAAKTAGNGLTARFDWFDAVGHEVSVEWVHSAGGTDETATVKIQVD